MVANSLRKVGAMSVYSLAKPSTPNITKMNRLNMFSAYLADLLVENQRGVYKRCQQCHGETIYAHDKWTFVISTAGDETGNCKFVVDMKSKSV